MALSLAVLISTVFALGKYSVIYRFLLSVFPQFGFIRFPIKYIVLAIFCFPLLAALGISARQERPE